jgi:ProP effector
MTKQKYNEALTAIALLADKYPACFAMLETRRRPLKVDIHIDLAASLNGAMKPSDLHNALRIYTHVIPYLSGMHTGATRINLDGQAAGTVSIEAARKAGKELVERLSRADARRKARREAARAASPVHSSLDNQRSRQERRQEGSVR